MATAAQLKAERIAAQQEAAAVKQQAAAPTATQKAQTAIVAQVVAAAIVNSPAVLNAPKGSVPSVQAVQEVAKQVAAAVAPTVAPTLSPAAIQSIVKATSTAVVANPEVKAADIGTVVSPKVVEKIASSVINAPEVVKVASEPTSELIPAPTPTVKMPTPAVQPGAPGFVGPVVPIETKLKDLEKQSSEAVKATEAAVAEGEAAAAAATTAEAEGNLAAITAGTKPVSDILPAGTSPLGGGTPRTVFEIVDNNDGTKTIVYSNGDKEIIGNKTDPNLVKPTTNIDVMKAQLKGLGFSSAVIDASTGFLSNLLAEGLDYDNATDIFLNNQEYTLKNGTKMKSPFYAEYGYLNEVLASPKPPSELYNAVEGYKIVQQRFNLDKKFISPDYLKELVKNNVDVQTFSERANIARLAAINADPAKVQALIKLGNIKDATGLTDFYLDPKIGQEVMQQNVNTAAFVTEAVRRAQSGIAIDTDYARKIGAELTAKGLSEAQVTGVAAQGYEIIGQQLNPLVKLEQIYGQRTGMGSMPESQLRADLQKQLEAEQFGGTASELLRKRTEQEQLAFQRKSGTIGASRMSGGSLGTKSTTGLL